MDNTKILKLTTFDGSPTEFVALVNEFGKVEPVFYDMSKPESKKALELDYEYHFDKEKYFRHLEELGKAAAAQEFQAAQKINYRDYFDPVFFQGEFHRDVMSFISECNLAGSVVPPYVNGSLPIEVSTHALDAQLVIEDYLFGFDPKVVDNIDPDSIKELQTALDIFGSKNKNRIQGYKPDSNKIVLLDEYQGSA